MNQNLKDVFEEFNLPFETYFTRGVFHKQQMHGEIELMWVLRGNTTIICDEKTYELSQQNLFMVNVDQVHTVESSEDSIVITYRFKQEHLEENDISFQSLRFENRVYTLQELITKYKEVPLLIAQLLSILLSKEESRVIRYKIIGFYNMFVYELYTMLLKEKYLDVKKKNVDLYLERVHKITDYVQNNFKENVSLKKLSEMIGLSTYRVSHFVKEYFGVSLQEYVKNFRLEHAMKLLRDTTESVVDVSKSAGFSDVKYLNAAIKEKLGITALKYRKLMSHSNDWIISNIDDFKNELRVCLNGMEAKLGGMEHVL